MVSSSSSPDDDTAEQATGAEPAEGNAPGEPAEVRLQKALANAGVASRRASENLIVAGRVEVNGVVVNELGSRINPEVDTVTVDGQVIQLDVSKRYLMLNKPRGVVSTMRIRFCCST